MAKVDLGAIRKAETPASGKEPFRLDEFQELVKLGYCNALDAKSAAEAYTQIKPETFVQAYRYQRFVLGINVVNEQKRRAGGAAK